MDTNNCLDTSVFDLVLDYVNHTNSSVFLTGKAGTGKTTFLQYLKQVVKKNTIVVAPTGVAAVNAGGVTMHSMFSLPFKPFIKQPISEHDNGMVMSQAMFLASVRLSKEKRDIIRSLQLLIIDEVSMVRCDMLDAIDVLLKKERRSNLPFGGVQVLFIGDMYQLPPVVTEEDRVLLAHYYRNFYFFNAEVFGLLPLKYIELKKIFRQSDATFIDVLNKIRTNTIGYGDLDLINERYQPSFEPQDEEAYITLTAINAKSDAINTRKLNKLKGEAYSFKGKLVGDFNEKNVPCPLDLKLKVGAQVMFVKNDVGHEKRYYNGRIATVTKLDEEAVYVQCANSDKEFKVVPETWENIKYVLKTGDEAIGTEVLGTFTQLPLRLAWAITIHKSQGLTFEKVILDLGDSFEFGQVYVALSRCKSMEGIVLLSKIEQDILYSNQQIMEFASREQPDVELREELPALKHEYACQYLEKAFDFGAVIEDVHHFFTSIDGVSVLHKQTGVVLKEVLAKLEELNRVALKFIPQLKELLRQAFQSRKNEILLQRLNAAVVYFCEFYEKNILEQMYEHAQLMSKSRLAKEYYKKYQKLYNDVYDKLIEVRNMDYEGTEVGGALPDYQSLKLGGKKEKEVKMPTKEITLKMFVEGKSIEGISDERKLAVSTIETHLAQAVEEGKLAIDKVMDSDRVQKIANQIQKLNLDKTAEIKERLGENVSYKEIRFARAFIASQQNKL